MTKRSNKCMHTYTDSGAKSYNDPIMDAIKHTTKVLPQSTASTNLNSFFIQVCIKQCRRADLGPELFGSEEEELNA